MGRPGERVAVEQCAVDEGEDFLVERDHGFGVELAERDLEPGSLPGDLVDAVEFEVE